ncbi:30S ribosomal protein S4 [Candidatus Nesciobacter abundans]|uniref:Small ribosomal subunit protein uS4 n=1 Tax=Candidatus Nesciobacter abundans TaxID=2601668 RepID=A0A5C0UGZ1_9PROT|nr:30S ribosomal protein S4 [Candidatus Nesciobacter abundans]QEK38967.1 30S ribosomal protein S4 [Candidatus Nesciobacter abundans]
MPSSNAKYKKDRSYGVNIWGRAKSPLNGKRNSRPGQHGSKRMKKLSNYALQLRAKQMFRVYHNLREKQFVRLFKNAMNAKGDTGLNMVRILERTLVTFVYRMKLASTIFAARQLVVHHHVLVNGKRVDKPSYLLAVGDVVTLAEKSKNIGNIRAATESEERDVPGYYEVTEDGIVGKLLKFPDNLDEVPYPSQMNMDLVVEYYSRSI